MPTAGREVQAALVTLWTGSFAGTDTKVHDGPRARTASPRQYLLVGVNGLDEQAAGLRSTQQASPMDGSWRQENGEIDCTLVTWSGDPRKLPDIRADSDAAIAICEQAVNDDPSLAGLLVPADNRAELIGLDTREAQTDKGPFVEAVFTIAYSTLLTS